MSRSKTSKPQPSLSDRRVLADLLVVFGAIARIVDEARESTARGIQDAAIDRKRADDWLTGAQTRASGPARLHELARCLIDEREALALALENIAQALANTGIDGRTRADTTDRLANIRRTLAHVGAAADGQGL